MSILKKTIRVAAIGLAVLFIGLSLFGIFGAWFVDRKTTDVVLKVFGVIETGVGVVNAGVGRVDDLIAKSRTEVRQASETIAAAGAQAQANSPVLNALNERLETSLAPRIAQMQQVLAPVRDAVGTVANAVSLVNSLPMMKDRAPRLAALDDALNRLQELSADAIQLRGTLRALVAGQNRDITAETVATLNRLTQRIDTRLGEVQANVDGVQADIAALQARLDTRKSRLLFLFNLLALLCTLMLAWILYTQGVVIQHHWARMRRPAANRRPADTSWG
jgi:phage shock protein A